MRMTFYCIAVLAVTVCTSSSNRTLLLGADEPGVIIDHKTLYQNDAIEGIRRFEIKGAINGKTGKGTLLMDKNECKLNAFGDRVECQLAAYKPVEVVFTLVEGDAGADPSPSKDRKIFAITRIPDDVVIPNLVLMVSPKTPFRLVNLDRSGTRRAITLEPRSAYDGAAK